MTTAPATIHPATAYEVRLTQRGRVLVLVVFVALLFALLGLWSAGSVAVPTNTRLESTRAVVVSSGQTLWDIAAEAQPTADPRATIERILDLNGMDGLEQLQAGQRVAIPAE